MRSCESNRDAPVRGVHGASHLLVLACACLAFPAAGHAVAASSAQVQQVAIGDNVWVSATLLDTPHVEPSLAFDPEEPRNALVASIVIDASGRWRCAAYRTEDGGSSWAPVAREALASAGDCGDPWVAFGSDGRVYISLLHGETSDIGRTEEILVLSSPDGGRTWGQPTVVPAGPDNRGGFDHPTMVVDTSGGPRDGAVYIIAAQSVLNPHAGLHNAHPMALLVSTDAGGTFTAPLRVRPTDLVHQVGTPVVLGDGTLVLSFYDFAVPNHQRLLTVRRLFTVRSTDGGRTMSAPAFVAEIAAYRMFANLAAAPAAGSAGQFPCRWLSGDRARRVVQ